MPSDKQKWENLKWVGGALVLSAFTWVSWEAIKANRELDRQAALANPKKRKNRTTEKQWIGCCLLI